MECVSELNIKLTTFAQCLLVLFFCTPSYADSPYSWYVFNIPPFGSISQGGIGYELVHAYSEAGLSSNIFVATPARWQIDMTNPQKLDFCTSGSWKLPNTSHRVYSDSMLNTVDYGVAVRPELYHKLTNKDQKTIISIIDVIESSKSAGSLIILKGRPVFGYMGRVLNESAQKDGVKM